MVNSGLGSSVESPASVSCRCSPGRREDNLSLSLAKSRKTCFDLFQKLGISIFVSCKLHRDEWDTYKSNKTQKVDIQPLLPLLQVCFRDLSHLAQHAMVQHHPVQFPKRLDGRINHSGRKRKVRQIAIDHFDLFAVLLLELLEGLDAAGYNDEVVRLRRGEEVLCDGETDAWYW